MYNRFFIISRMSEDGKVSYFRDFIHKALNDSREEDYGIEEWADDSLDYAIVNALEFDTFQEAKDYLNAIVKDTEKFSYEIILCRNYDEEKDKEYPSKIVPLKCFYTTDEEFKLSEMDAENIMKAKKIMALMDYVPCGEGPEPDDKPFDGPDLYDEDAGNLEC